MLVTVNAMHYVSVALVATALLASAPSYAEVYKWTDEDGNVVYSQTPPPGQDAETIKPRYAKQPTGVARPSPAGPTETDKSTDAGVETPEAKYSPEQLALKKQNCANAQQQITDMNHPRISRMQYKKENGELAYITPDIQNARLSEAQSMAKKYCD